MWQNNSWGFDNFLKSDTLLNHFGQHDLPASPFTGPGQQYPLLPTQPHTQGSSGDNNGFQPQSGVPNRPALLHGQFANPLSQVTVVPRDSAQAAVGPGSRILC
jgi:hypothetical protein